MDITTPPIEKYVYSLLPPRDAVLRDMEAEAARRSIPIVGPAVGRFFYQLARMIGAKTVFEMGSAIGYSTIWWAMAVGEGGHVVYTDSDRKNADEARRNFERAGVEARVETRLGDALELLSEEKRQFDIIFNERRQGRLSPGIPPGGAAGAQGRIVRQRQRTVARAGRRASQEG